MSFKEDPQECEHCDNTEFKIYKSSNKARLGYIKIECQFCKNAVYYRVTDKY